MNVRVSNTRFVTISMFSLIGLMLSTASAATFNTPRQLGAEDTYELDPDAKAAGDDVTTCPKLDTNTGTAGDNPYFLRTNVSRAHNGGCNVIYWYTSAQQAICTDPTPVNTCGAGPCVNEPDPVGPQYVDYAPPFGPGAAQLTPGRYQIIGEYRNEAIRATYPAEYVVNYSGGTTTVLQNQSAGTVGSCISFTIGTFDLNAGSFVRVNDAGPDSISFNRMRFVLVSALGGAPLANAGADQTVILPASASLVGIVSDDGLPSPLSATWSQVSGPGTANFLDPSSPSTTAGFTAAGSYVLRLTAFDGATSTSDDITITVLSAGTTLTYSTQYEFDAEPSTAAGVLDANAGDANGDGLLTKATNSANGGFGNAGGEVVGGILHFVDTSNSGNFGYYWQNGGTALSYTVDLAIRVTSGVGGSTNKRSMAFSAGPSKNLGFRLNKVNDGGTGNPCTVGSVRFAAASGGSGTEGCEDFTTDPTQFHHLRVAVDAPANTFTVFDLDTQTQISSASGSVGNAGKTNLSWASEIDDKGGFHIGSISGTNTNPTNYEMDYFRILLGVAVNSPSTNIFRINQCHSPAFDADGDGDVDMNDFGTFQACFTGSSTTLTGDTCRCFDRNSDNHIDEVDFNIFRTCAVTSGPGIPANVSICNGS